MYQTIIKEQTAELVEKKSKFIANIYFIESKQEAENKIKEIKKKYYDARHNCISYRVLENGQLIEKSSDDGEPSGTAGGPMLNILQKNNLCNILVIVTRYFGGILLGTGGLVRAYSDVVLKAISKATLTEFNRGIEFCVKFEYNNLGIFKHFCEKYKIHISDLEYGDDVKANIIIKEEDINSFKKSIENKEVNVTEYVEMGEKLIYNLG